MRQGALPALPVLAALGYDLGLPPILEESLS
jgi:hypothetical protein